MLKQVSKKRIAAIDGRQRRRCRRRWDLTQVSDAKLLTMIAAEVEMTEDDDGAGERAGGPVLDLCR